MDVYTVFYVHLKLKSLRRIEHQPF